MGGCKDPKYEQMLHAFELGMLSESEQEELQIHLLECEHCFEKAIRFQDAAVLLRNDLNLMSAIDQLTKKKQPPRGIRYKLKNILWPDKPRFFLAKPIALVIILLFLSYPAYRVITTKMPRIEQTINLFPLRSSGESIIYKDKGGEVLINFVYEWAKPGGEYMVLIARPGGYSPYANRKFTGFNDQGLGSVVLYVDQFKRGSYLLKVEDPASDDPDSKVFYYFKVE